MSQDHIDVTGQIKMEGNVLLLERPVDGVVLLKLNRPERLNAMTAELVEGLHETLAQIAVDRSCRVVVLTGSG
jgi:enoyl-CoA hydratase